MTKRQLRAAGLRENGHPPVGRIRWPRSGRFANLFDVSKAAPKRPMTPGRWHAVAAMLIARSTCPECREAKDFCIPTSLGMCWPCAVRTGVAR
jgi:hypothetical protein